MTGNTGPTGATGATGSNTTGGSVAVFVSNGNIGTSGNCIALQWLNSGGADAVCPAAVAANAFSQEANYLLGPIPAAGATISNIEAVTNVATVAGVTVTIVDNTTGATLISCAYTTGTTSCTNAASVIATAGHYLEVKVTDTARKQHRVSFRF